MDCTIQLKLQLLIELACIEEGKDFFFLNTEVNLYFFVHCNVSLLDVMMRKMGFRHREVFLIHLVDEDYLN